MHRPQGGPGALHKSRNAPLVHYHCPLKASCVNDTCSSRHNRCVSLLHLHPAVWGQSASDPRLPQLNPYGVRPWNPFEF